jgi:hypothetical protein
MDPAPACNCLHCNKVFVTDARHRRDQHYCGKPACRRASKAASQRRWLGRPENRDYFHGSVHVRRVQAWRARHPEYWKRTARTKTIALQDSIERPQSTDRQKDNGLGDEDCVTRDVLPLWKSQPPVLLGLIAQLSGSTLQETIAQMTDRLFEKGQAVMGQRT